MCYDSVVSQSVACIDIPGKHRTVYRSLVRTMPISAADLDDSPLHVEASQEQRSLEEAVGEMVGGRLERTRKRRRGFAEGKSRSRRITGSEDSFSVVIPLIHFVPPKYFASKRSTVFFVFVFFITAMADMMDTSCLFGLSPKRLIKKAGHH
jgi:hypothetical protein